MKLLEASRKKKRRSTKMEGKWVRAAAFFVLVSGWYCCCCYGCLDEERIALLNLKNSMNLSTGFNPLASWGLHGDCCNWTEVKCNITTKRVIQLSLNETRFGESNKWYLNSSLFLAFEDLKVLFLGDNQIKCFMENEGLEKLLSLKNLEILDLSGNTFGDCFNNGGSYDLSRLSKLEFLDLSLNSLNNSVLSYLVGLSSLKTLNLASNELKGSLHIPGSYGLSKLSKLEFLDLSFNQLDNNIVSSLAGLSSLKTLNLAGNGLKGSLHIQGVNNLEVLDLSDNSFGESILSSLREFRSLKILSLWGNKLKGLLNITGLVALNKLEELDLGDNEIKSFWAPKDRSLSRLKVLHLYLNNNPCGSCMLKSMSAFSSIKTLDLTRSTTTVKPYTAEGFHIFKKLEVLILDGTSLDNDFLRNIGILGSLKALSMSSCNINGTLPSQGWCELKNLEELDLSGNNFEGRLPSCFGNLSHLMVLDISYNHFLGNIATSPFTNMKSLEYLSFSSNNFQIPASFSVFSNHSNLKVLLANNNEAITEPLLQNSPSVKIQLKFLSLSNISLKELPTFLIHQTDLRVLDLSNNNITGGFPSWLFKNNRRLEVLNLRSNSISGPLQLLPSQPLFNITFLDVSNNRLYGKVPLNFSSIFPYLEVLIMSKNAFKGEIPVSFGDMRSLVSLSLSNNQFVGSIPNSLGGHGLHHLDISNNLLSGAIPKELVMGCLGLEVLKLSNNNLQGQVFPLLFNLNILEVLHLGGNNFGGDIPEFSYVESFSPSAINMSNNQFYGKLPRWMGNISSLQGLSLSNNHFEGPYPEEFCNLHSLEFLDLSDNNLSGSIPECFKPFDLKHIHLRNNRFTGPLPKAFYGSSTLETLDLTGNNLTGFVPDWIGSLSSLSTLLLKANHFEGGIPIQLCHLKKLRMLDLSQNHLSGPIPLCLSNLTFATTNSSTKGYTIGGYGVNAYSLSVIGSTKLAKIFAGFSTLKNDIVDVQEWVEFTTKSMSYIYSGSIINYMSGIDLSCNNLTGRIPSEVGNLNKIHALNLSHNYLSGPIPPTFSNLKQIESLDLSYNHLNGRIPPQLTELNYMSAFSVAYNNLSGPTPDQKGQFSTFSERSYDGNPLLCGAPLRNNCSRTESTPKVQTGVSNGNKEAGGYIDMSFFYWSFTTTFVTVLMGITAVLIVSPSWRRAWFYFIEVCTNSCYYFVLDNLCSFSKRIS